MHPVKTWLFLGKLVGYLIVILVLGSSLAAILHLHEAKLLTEFESLRETDPLPEARKLVDAGLYCDALEYLDYFRDYNYVKNSPEVTAFYEKIRAERESYWFRARDVFNGIWRGKGACMESLVSATASDFFVVGDLRDLAWQGYNFYQGRNVDEFTAALAGVGVLLTVPTIVSGAGAAPVKGAASLLKLAKRTGKLTKPLQNSLTKLFKEAVRLRDLKPLKPVVSPMEGIAGVPGVKARDVMAIVSRCDSVADLKTMEKLAAAYGPKTGKFLKLGEDSAVSVVTKYGTSRQITAAMDEAIKYGPEGTRLLEKTGPKSFMKYLTMAKYGVRATRSAWRGRLINLTAQFLRLFPMWVIYLIAALSGMVVVGVPARIVVSRLVRKIESQGGTEGK